MSRLSDENAEYIKEDDLILIQLKKEIREVLVKDLSPSGNYMRVTTPTGHNSMWINTIFHIETLVSGEDDDTEYVDVGDGEDLIGDEWKVSIVEPEEEPEAAEVITQNTLAKFDKRNKRK
jgi:hypothetical protein